MTNQTATVTMGSTKKELFEAYETMKQNLEKKEHELLNAEETRKQAEKTAALAQARKETENDPVKRIHDLRVSLGKELFRLAEVFEEEMNTFKSVSLAVAEKQQELKALYDIEAVAADLAVLIAAQNEQKKCFEEEKQEKKSAFEQEMKSARDEFEREKAERLSAWQKTVAEHDAEAAAAEQQLERNRQREAEDYDYNLNREREQRRNQLNDELRKLEKELEQKRGSFEAAVTKRDGELTQRETAVAEREKVIAELQAEVEAFPGEKELAVNQAVAGNTERLKADFNAQQALNKATADGEKRVLQGRIEALEKLVESQNAQLDKLSSQQENAYQKVQDIANRAVEAARREFVSYPMSPAGQEKTIIGSDRRQV